MGDRTKSDNSINKNELLNKAKSLTNCYKGMLSVHVIVILMKCCSQITFIKPNLMSKYKCFIHINFLYCKHSLLQLVKTC